MAPPIIPRIEPKIEKPIPANPITENTSTIIPKVRISYDRTFIIIASASTIIPETSDSTRYQPPANPGPVHQLIMPPSLIIQPMGKASVSPAVQLLPWHSALVHNPVLLSRIYEQR